MICSLADGLLSIKAIINYSLERPGVARVTDGCPLSCQWIPDLALQINEIMGFPLTSYKNIIFYFEKSWDFTVTISFLPCFLSSHFKTLSKQSPRHPQYCDVQQHFQIWLPCDLNCCHPYKTDVYCTLTHIFTCN